MKWTISWFLLPLMLGAQTASANVSVYPMTLVLGKDNSGTLEIRSVSDAPSYIKITVKRLIYRMGALEPIEQDISAYKDGVFAVPNRLVIPAGAKRTIRFVSSTPAESVERAYRVYIETVPPMLDIKKSDESNKLQTAVSVNVIWGALLFVPPLERAPSLVYLPEISSLKNTGNTFLRVVNASACMSPSACKDIEFSIPPLPPQGQFKLPSLLPNRSNTKEVKFIYEDRSSKQLHELKITQ